MPPHLLIVFLLRCTKFAFSTLSPLSPPLSVLLLLLFFVQQHLFASPWSHYLFKTFLQILFQSCSIAMGWAAWPGISTKALMVAPKSTRTLTKINLTTIAFTDFSDACNLPTCQQQQVKETKKGYKK